MGFWCLVYFLDPLFCTQVSIESVPPPSQWTPGWRDRMGDLNMSSHLFYIHSFIISAKSIKCEIDWQRSVGGDSARAERKLQDVGCLHLTPVYSYNAQFNNLPTQLVEKRLAIQRFMLQVELRHVHTWLIHDCKACFEEVAYNMDADWLLLQLFRNAAKSSHHPIECWAKHDHWPRGWHRGWMVRVVEKRIIEHCMHTHSLTTLWSSMFIFSNKQLKVQKSSVLTVKSS